MENFLYIVIICTMILLSISLVLDIKEQLKESRKNKAKKIGREIVEYLNEHSENIWTGF